MRPKENSEFGKRVDSVRSFNRFYTRQLGLLNERLYGSRFSLTEVRLLFELFHRKETTATLLCATLGLDAGYLSRILQRFEKGRLIKRKASETDGRQNLIALTPQGRKAFAPLDARASFEVAAMLNKLSVSRQRRLLDAMGVIQQVFSDRERNSKYVLRRPRLGDMEWIVHRHGLFYGEQYGYDQRYEALVARITAEFIEHYDPRRERCWIAGKDGDVAGCVFLVKKSDAVAQLRLLFVEPACRGFGLGTHLVNECVRFAKQTGYRKITLWTQSDLLAARHIYESAGFRLVEKKRHRSWGRELTGETWELLLDGNAKG
jgi:DNA-binding MarR family transcriptional regulator/N-acetylglutamate synthase-like GNAT family acetyltransferase